MQRTTDYRLPTTTKKGFTLIELLLVIVILSIITLMSATFYARFLTQNAVANTADQLVNELRRAQLWAMMGKQNSAWGVNFSSNKITFFKGTSLGQDHSFDAVFNINSNISISGFSTMSFAHFSGLPTPAGPATLTISGANNSKMVTVNQQGVVSRL